MLVKGEGLPQSQNDLDFFRGHLLVGSPIMNYHTTSFIIQRIMGCLGVGVLVVDRVLQLIGTLLEVGDLQGVVGLGEGVKLLK